MSDLNPYFNNIEAFGNYPVDPTGFTYAFSHLPQLGEIFSGLSLAETAGDGDTLMKARRVMQWVADYTTYDGASPLGPARPGKIIKFAIEEKKPINCANRAILFCDALVSLGIFAFPVNLQHRPYLPAESRLGDSCHSHVIAQVWLPERGCWAAFDPSFNTYFTDSAGDPVSIPAMLRMQRTDDKARSVDNLTGEPTENGALCTQIGLFDVSVFPGNDFTYRYHWDELVFLVPRAYLDIVAKSAPDDGWEVWHNRLLNSRKISMADLEGEPRWVDCV